jgi:hypothetical protein
MMRTPPTQHVAEKVGIRGGISARDLWWKRGAGTHSQEAILRRAVHEFICYGLKDMNALNQPGRHGLKSRSDAYHKPGSVF